VHFNGLAIFTIKDNCNSDFCTVEALERSYQDAETIFDPDSYPFGGRLLFLSGIARKCLLATVKE